MQRVKNQHYVPQFCLRRFTTDGSSIFVFNKPDMRVFKTDVRNVAAENGFYNLSPEFVDDFQVIEKWLADIEKEAASAIDFLIKSLEAKGSFNHRDYPLRTMIGMFIGLQHVRTDLFRRTQTERREKIADELNRRGIETPKELLNVSDEKIKLQHAKVIRDPEFLKEFARILCGHLWMVGENRSDLPFYISDAPVTRYAHVKPPPFRSAGFESKGIEVNFPLSSRYLLMLCERSHFAEGIGDDEGRIFFWKKRTCDS